MPFYTQRQSLQPLQQDKSIERADGSTRIAQQHGTYTDNVGSSPGSIDKPYPMITCIRLGQLREFTGSNPVKFTGIDNNSSQRTAVSANEFCGRMYHNVCPVLNGTDKVRRTESIIHDQRNPIFMGNGSYGIHIDNIGIGVSQSFNEYRLCIFTNRPFEIKKIGRIYKSGRYSISRQGMRQQVVCAPINGLGSHNMITGTGDILDSIGHSSSSGSHGKTTYSPFKCCDAFLQYSLSGIGQSSINIPRVLQSKSCGGMGRIPEHIGSCLINRYGTRIGCRVGSLLSNMEL